MKNMKNIKYLFLITFIWLSTACESDFPNPNAPTIEEVVNSPEGLQGLIIGTQFRYTIGAASSLYASITAAGLSTNELRVLNAGNADIAALELGGDNVAPNNPVVTNLWTNLNLVRFNAEKLIENANVMPDAGRRAGVQIYGHLFKALALGTMAQFWEQAIIQTGPNAAFVTRNAALDEAISLLDAASSLLATSTIPASFNTQVGSNINLDNSLKALSARYNLMRGNYATAFSKASSVSLTSQSRFLFNNVSQNPIFRSSLTTNNVYDVKPNFGLTGALAPNPSDGRIAFYLTAQAGNGKGFFLGDATSIPLYLPGEMLLIMAEAKARLDELPAAVIELNKVLAKTAGTDVYGVGANLPAYNGANTQTAILEEIYRNRCIELFMTGLKLEDSRRFGRPGFGQANAERTRNFYPYPVTERNSNPNTPDNPVN
jgi:hypothetical protein